MMFFKKSLCVSIILFALSACSIQPTLVEHRAVIEQAPTEQTPLVSPYKSTSTMREALACMDRMLLEEQIPSTLIAVKNIPDASGLFMTGTKEMIITALSRMSRISRIFRVVDFEIDSYKQDTVEVLTHVFEQKNQLNLRKPEIYISGAISFGDKTVVTKRNSLGFSTKNTDAGYSWDVMGTTVGLDLHLGEMDTRTLLPGIDSANELVIASGGKAVELGGRTSGLPRHIYELGIQFERSAENNQGAGAAIRLLTDLATIELVGKWAKIPYWECIGYERNHPEFKRQLRAWYDELDTAEHIALAQRILKQNDLWHNEIDGKDSFAIRQAIANYQSAYDLIPLGTLTFETYASLIGNYAGITAADLIQADDLSPKKLRLDKLISNNTFEDTSYPESISTESDFDIFENIANIPLTEVPGALPSNTPEDTIISIAIVGHDKSVGLDIGDNIVLNIIPRKTGYLYCYYKNINGSIRQIYPNVFQPHPIVQGQHSLTIPDITKIQNFEMMALKEGEEGAYCAMTLRPLHNIDSKFITGNFQEIEGIQDIEVIRQSLETTGQVIASGHYLWVIDEPVDAEKRNGK